VRVRHDLLGLGLQPLTQRFPFWPNSRNAPARAGAGLLREAISLGLVRAPVPLAMPFYTGVPSAD
jgi:hypothetical protein